MLWTKLTFGKYTGKTLPQVIFEDPDWFFWAYEKNVLKGTLAKEAEQIYKKACSIRVPQEEEEKMEVEYFIQPLTHKFSHFELVPISKPLHVGSSPAFRSSKIDLSWPRSIAPYDKQGAGEMVRRVKHYLFGSSRYVMTKQRCEDFFDNDENFDLRNQSSE